MRLAVVNQAGGGGATQAAREVLVWGPSRGIEVSWFPQKQGETTEDLLAALEQLAPDVVHLHCWYQSYDYDLLQRLGRRFPVAFTLHDVFVVNQYGVECWECYRNAWCLGCPALEPVRRWRPNYRIRDRLRKRRVNQRTRCHLVFPSSWMGRRLAKSEWSRLPSSVIPNGLDTEAFRPGPSRRSELGLPDGPLALFVGNMYSPDDHRKGLPDLLASFEKVHRDLPDARLVVAGRLEGMEPPPGTHVLGEIPNEDLVGVYRSVDLFCLPTRGDNMPVTVVEAMATGLPVVATRVGGIPEQVVHGETGLLVEPGNPGVLAQALAELLQDPDRAAAMGHAGRARANERFSRERSAEGHTALYRRLAQRGS